MQKKIIALAIAAAFSAPAMAEVTVYGVVDAAVVNVSGDGQQGDLLALSGGLAGSRFGVTAAEDVAYGMKAVVKVEYALDTQSATGKTGAGTTTSGACSTTAVDAAGNPATCTVGAGTSSAASNGSGIGAARQQMVALAGEFGTVATGYLQTTGYDFAVKFDPTAGSSVSPLQVVTKSNFVIGTVAAGARAPRALAYISPKIADSVTVAVNYTTDLTGGLGNAANTTAVGDTKTTAYLMSATYEAGPLAVGGVYTGVSAAGSSVATEFAFGASYDLGMAKVMGTYQSNTPNGGNASTALSMSVVAPVGPGAVVASYAANSMDAANSSGSGLVVAYLQGLSKTTTAYAAFESVSQDSGTRGYSVGNNILSAASLDLGGSSTLFAVGLKKVF